MNYVRIYDEICSSAKKVQNQSECVQRGICAREAAGKWCGTCPRIHLIIPAGIWGSTDDPATNTIYLTAAQQVVAYALLCKIYPYSKHIRDTYRALKRARGKKRRKIPIRRKPHSAATRAKMSASHTGKTFSPESRRKMSESKKGKSFTAEHIKNRSEARKRNGRGFSPETIEKMRLAAKNRKKNVVNSWSVSQ